MSGIVVPTQSTPSEASVTAAGVDESGETVGAVSEGNVPPRKAHHRFTVSVSNSVDPLNPFPMTSVIPRWELRQAIEAGRVTAQDNRLPAILRVMVGAFLAWMAFLGGWMFTWMGNPGYPGSHPGSGGLGSWQSWEALADSPLLAFPAVMFLAGVGGVFSLAFWRDRVTLDLAARAYRWERGLFPFVRRRRGRVAEFDHVRVGLEWVFDGAYMGGLVWCIRLARNEDGAGSGRRVRSAAPTPCPGFAIGGGLPESALCQIQGEAQELARNMAEKVGLPLRDESSLPAPVRPPLPETSGKCMGGF